jgi:hypothetical protein
MAEDIPNPWPNHPLLEEEDEEVDILEEEVHSVAARGQLYVVGKLIGDKYVSKETLKTALVRWWRPEKSVCFKVLGENLFLIEFEKSEDKKKVLDGCPWAFKGDLFLVEDFTGQSSPTEISFDRASFWVRMLRLPLVCMEREVGKKIGATVGIVEEVDMDANGVGWGEYLRVKISVDLSKPLSMGRKVNL